MAQPQQQALLLVPPRQVQGALSELAALRWTAQKWQHGGRYGVQVRRAPAADGTGTDAASADDGRADPRAIPVTAAAAAALAAAIDGPDAVALPPTLLGLARSSAAAGGTQQLVRFEPLGQQRRQGQQQRQQRACDHTVHPERAFPLPVPPGPADQVASASRRVPGAFRFVVSPNAIPTHDLISMTLYVSESCL